MSSTFNKMWSKLLAVIVIILFVVGFREMILTDSDVSKAFGGLMSILPFAKKITDAICKVMKYQFEIPPITSSSVIADFLKLAVMASIQPIVVGFLSLIFLRVPEGSIEEREEYMDGKRYREKELILKIATAPFIALAAAHITSTVSNYLTSHFGAILSTVLGIVSIVIMSAISLIPLLITGTAIVTAILWRLVVTLLWKMATTMGTNVICLWLFLSITGGLHMQTFSAIVALIVWLIIMDVALTGIKRAVV